MLMGVTVKKLSKDEILAEIRMLEEKHRMSSQVFLEQYNYAKLPHHRDFVRWVGLCRMAASNGRVTGANASGRPSRLP